MTSESLQNTRNGRSRSNSRELFDRFLLEAELQQNGTEDFEQKLRKVTKERNFLDDAIFNPVAVVKSFGKKNLTTDRTDTNGQEAVRDLSWSLGFLRVHQRYSWLKILNRIRCHART